VKRFFTLAELQAERATSGKRYLEFLRVPALSSGIYVLPKDGVDQQAPHQQDEIYFVVSGRAHMKITRDGEMPEDRAMTGGTVIFVEAGTEHRFHSIEEELVVLVVFGPAETES
jgi:mannose-6-phosphate isomerase-like protein (cupin superfamily)